MFPFLSDCVVLGKCLVAVTPSVYITPPRVSDSSQFISLTKSMFFNLPASLRQLRKGGTQNEPHYLSIIEARCQQR